MRRVSRRGDPRANPLAKRRASPGRASRARERLRRARASLSRGRFATPREPRDESQTIDARASRATRVVRFGRRLEPTPERLAFQRASFGIRRRRHRVASRSFPLVFRRHPPRAKREGEREGGGGVARLRARRFHGVARLIQRRRHPGFGGGDGVRVGLRVASPFLFQRARRVSHPRLVRVAKEAKLGVHLLASAEHRTFGVGARGFGGGARGGRLDAPRVRERDGVGSRALRLLDVVERGDGDDAFRLRLRAKRVAFAGPSSHHLVAFAGPRVASPRRRRLRRVESYLRRRLGRLQLPLRLGARHLHHLVRGVERVFVLSLPGGRLRGGLERAHRRPFFPLLRAPRLGVSNPRDEGLALAVPRLALAIPLLALAVPLLANARRGLALGRRSPRRLRLLPLERVARRDAFARPRLAFLRNLLRRLLPRAPRILRAQRLLVRVQRLATRLHVRGRRQRLVALRLEQTNPRVEFYARRRDVLLGAATHALGDVAKRRTFPNKRRAHRVEIGFELRDARVRRGGVGDWGQSSRGRLRLRRVALAGTSRTRRGDVSVSVPRGALGGVVARAAMERGGGGGERDGNGAHLVWFRGGGGSRAVGLREGDAVSRGGLGEGHERALANALVFGRTVVADGERARGGVYGRAGVGVARG